MYEYRMAYDLSAVNAKVRDGWNIDSEPVIIVRGDHVDIYHRMRREIPGSDGTPKAVTAKIRELKRLGEAYATSWVLQTMKDTKDSEIRVSNAQNALYNYIDSVILEAIEAHYG